MLEPLGSGGMGSLWVAEHLGLRSQVVVKLLKETLSGNGVAIARFRREATAAASVRSPHVVQLLDHGISKAYGPFIVMERLDGNDLRGLLARGEPLSRVFVVEVVRQLGRALDRVHAAGLIHRDVTPANIFLCSGEPTLVKLVDFGIAKSTSLGSSELTSTGSVIGTPSYMSPEQLIGERELDARSDVWSLGVVVFQCLTGQKPFHGNTPSAVALAIHTGATPRLTALDGGLPASVDRWFARVCAKKRDDRFESAGAAALALSDALSANAHENLPGETEGTQPYEAGPPTSGAPPMRFGKARRFGFGVLALFEIGALVFFLKGARTQSAAAPNVAVPTAASVFAPPEAAAELSLPPPKSHAGDDARVAPPPSHAVVKRKGAAVVASGSAPREMPATSSVPRIATQTPPSSYEPPSERR